MFPPSQDYEPPYFVEAGESAVAAFPRKPFSMCAQDRRLRSLNLPPPLGPTFTLRLTSASPPPPFREVGRVATKHHQVCLPQHCSRHSSAGLHHRSQLCMFL